MARLLKHAVLRKFSIYRRLQRK